MDQHLIKALIDALAASELFELEYSAGGESLRLVKTGAAPVALPEAASAQPVFQTRPTAAPVAAGVATSVVTAPLYGVVHMQRSPDLPPLVSPGDTVAAGQVLCLMEAMKVFTELRAECAGTVEAVLVTNGQEVETGQPLFRIT